VNERVVAWLNRLPLNDERMAAWMDHPEGCTCPSCEYVNANLDRDDDLGEATDGYDF
jgi:hypothetical protein